MGFVYLCWYLDRERVSLVCYLTEMPPHCMCCVVLEAVWWQALVPLIEHHESRHPALVSPARMIARGRRRQLSFTELPWPLG